MFIEDYCLIYSCYDDNLACSFGSLHELIVAIFNKCWALNAFNKQHFCRVNTGEKTLGIFTCDINLNKYNVNICFINYLNGTVPFDSFVCNLSKNVYCINFAAIVKPFTIHIYLK